MCFAFFLFLVREVETLKVLKQEVITKPVVV